MQCLRGDPHRRQRARPRVAHQQIPARFDGRRPGRAVVQSAAPLGDVPLPAREIAAALPGVFLAQQDLKAVDRVQGEVSGAAGTG